MIPCKDEVFKAIEKKPFAGRYLWKYIVVPLNGEAFLLTREVPELSFAKFAKAVWILLSSPKMDEIHTKSGRIDVYRGNNDELRVLRKCHCPSRRGTMVGILEKS